jgi:hypothetical protein
MTLLESAARGGYFVFGDTPKVISATSMPSRNGNYCDGARQLFQPVILAGWHTL